MQPSTAASFQGLFKAIFRNYYEIRHIKMYRPTVLIIAEALHIKVYRSDGSHTNALKPHYANPAPLTPMQTLNPKP